MELVDQSAVSSAHDLKLYANKRGHLFVEDENAAYRIEKHAMNPLLREVVQRKALGKFVGDGYIRINKVEEGSSSPDGLQRTSKYTLAAKVRGNGGGAVLGQIFGWTVRGVGYGGYAVACWFDPILLLEAEVAHAAIEGTALAATVAGTAIPTPL